MVRVYCNPEVMFIPGGVLAGIGHLVGSRSRIVAVIDVRNEASLRVAERIGMTNIETIEAYGRPHILLAAQP
ncbi:MAG: GNAT family N-acetyltransferase [Gaiellaceae bacterium MAG52_C11]|nr:GNAT family N-acetyltransferase [Candidatus Gaiellasilicea maunaloa]